MLRPRHDISPKLKEEKDYSLQWCKFIYSESQQDHGAIKKSDIARILRNRSYAEGRQSPETYKKAFLDDGGQESPRILITDVDTGTGSVTNAREGWVDMNFDDIFSPLPKYVNNIVGIMENQEHDVVVEATDENSGAARAELKFSMYVKQQLKDVLGLIEQTFSVKLENENMPLPKSVEELDLYSNLGMFKLPYEIGQEKAISYTQHISDNSEIKKQLIVDAVTDGYISTYAYVDHGVVKYKHVDVTELIMENSKEKDFKDSSWFAIPEYYTIVDFRNENPDIPEPDIENLAKSVSGKYGNPSIHDFGRTDDGTYNYDDLRILVLYNVWKTTDSEYYTTRKNKKGELIEVYEPYRTTKKGKNIGPKIYNNEKEKTERHDLRTLYHAKWVVDTDIVFNYGKMFNIPYDYKFKDPPLPCRLYRVTNKPIIESLIPIEDQIEFTYLKLQNDIIKAKPAGMAIEFGALENISYGNRKLTPKDVLKVYSHTGTMFYRLAPTEAGSSQTSMPVPFQEIKGGYGEAIANAIASLDMLYRQLSIISGIDQYSSVNTTPASDAGKAVTEMAVAATGNTLKPIYSAYVKMKENISRIVALKIQAEILAYDNIEDCPYYKIIGAPLLLAIKTAGDFPPVEWGFKIIAKPTDQLKQEVQAAAQAALAGGKNGIPLLTYSEYLFIVEHLNTGGGIKYARLFLAHREGQAKAKEQEIAERNIQLQGQQNLMLKQAEVDKVQMETQKELAVVEMKGKVDMALEALKHENKMAELQVQLQAKQTTDTENVNK